MRRKERKAGSGLSGRPHLPRPPARSDQPLLREGIEPDAGRGHYWPQDVADAKKVYALESGGSGGDVEIVGLFP